MQVFCLGHRLILTVDGGVATKPLKRLAWTNTKSPYVQGQGVGKLVNRLPPLVGSTHRIFKYAQYKQRFIG